MTCLCKNLLLPFAYKIVKFEAAKSEVTILSLTKTIHL